VLVTISWYSSNATNQTRPVGGKVPNGFGLHDMSGNVREWVNDWYSSTYYASSPSTNPPGPATGANRVLRGGSWSVFQTPGLSSSTRGSSQGSGGPGDGFRVARTP
jgi:formylglycine-generating enzyme required for sulfatase activity